MTELSNKNHHLVDMLEIHVDTDGLEHEIAVLTTLMIPVFSSKKPLE